MSCGLYEPAIGVGCRRFEQGIVLRDDEDCWTGAHADIVWRRWAALKSKAVGIPSEGLWRFGFLLQLHIAFGGGPKPAELAFSRSPWSLATPVVRIQLMLGGGLNEIFVSHAEMQALAGSDAAEARLTLLDESSFAMRLYAAHFVEGVATSSQPGARVGPSRPCKLACLDLDHTVWNGIADEAAPASLTLFPGVDRALIELRRRRVKIAAVSRASPSVAESSLRRLGVRELFDVLEFVDISKAAAIRRIAGTLNLAPEEIVAIDDDPFERRRLRLELPGIGVLAAEALPSVWLHPWLSANMTALRQGPTRSPPLGRIAAEVESEVRPRLEYRVPSEEEALRCWELLQRTNRLNCVEWRPVWGRFAECIVDPRRTVRVGICADDLADYGLACLAVIDREQHAIQALTFSCRLVGRRFPDMFIDELLKEFGRLDVGATRGGERLAAHGLRLLKQVAAFGPDVAEVAKS